MTDVVNQEHSESSHIYTKTYGNHTYMINIDDGKLIFNITSPSKLITTKIDDSFCKEYNLTKEDMFEFIKEQIDKYKYELYYESENLMIFEVNLTKLFTYNTIKILFMNQ